MVKATQALETQNSAVREFSVADVVMRVDEMDKEIAKAKDRQLNLLRWGIPATRRDMRNTAAGLAACLGIGVAFAGASAWSFQPSAPEKIEARLAAAREICANQANKVGVNPAPEQIQPCVDAEFDKAQNSANGVNTTGGIVFGLLTVAFGYFSVRVAGVVKDARKEIKYNQQDIEQLDGDIHKYELIRYEQAQFLEKAGIKLPYVG